MAIDHAPMRWGAFAWVGIAVAASAADARAEGTPFAGSLNVGYIHSWVNGGSPASGNGVGTSYVYWEHRGRDILDQIGVGPIAQVESYSSDGGRHVRWALGGEVVYHGFFGIELAFARRGADDTHRATYGVHFAPYASIGFVTLALRTTIAIPPSDGHRSEYGLTLGFTIPIALPEWPKLGPDLVYTGASGRPLRDVCGVPIVYAARMRGPSRAGRRDVRAARRWMKVAEMEHASVATFRRLARELLASKAPRRLVVAARRAAREEAGHARLACAMVTRHARREVELPRLPRKDLRARNGIGAARLAAESFVEGCVGEGVAAARASRGSTLAKRKMKGAEARALSQIAREEATHAELAWAIVSWGLAVAPVDARRALSEASRVAVWAEAGASRSTRRALVAARARLVATMVASGRRDG